MSVNKRIRKFLNEDKEEVFYIPSLAFVNYDWDTFIQFLEYEGLPKWSFGDSLYLNDVRDLTSLYNLVHVDGTLDLEGCVNLTSLGLLETVGGYLDLKRTGITSLGNLKKVLGALFMKRTGITTFGNLEYVGSMLNAVNCRNLAHFGELKYVGGYLDLTGTELAENFSEDEIRKIIHCRGAMFLHN